MSLILSGTDGLSDVDGSASTPAIRGTDTNTGIFFPAADTIAFAEGGAEVARFDSSGNFGIGTSSPASFDPAARNLVVGTGTGNQGLSIYAGSASAGSIYFANGSSGANLYKGYIGYIHSSDAMQFATNGSERMRIDSSGNLLLGTTSGVANGVINLSFNGASKNGIGLKTTLASTGTDYIVFENNGGSTAGRITQNGTTTVSYTTSSDYRLKENIAPMTGALDTVSALKPVTYNWKVDGSSGQGFIAHELQAVVPDCVTGEKDAVETYIDEDGVEQTKPKYQGIDTSFLVATLTAAIQELKAELDGVKAELATLKA